MNLDNLGLAGPVTAVCVYKNIILAGCGRDVQVYSAATCDWLTSFSALTSATVHGLELGAVVDGKKLLCVFGAKCMRIFSLEVDSCLSGADDTLTTNNVSCRVEAVTAVRDFEDWIWTAVWLKGESGQWSIGVCLAHNVVLHWDWQRDVVLHRAMCVEKCILYCGHFIGQGWFELVLAAGTVFNQVVLWAPSSATDDRADHTHRSQPQPVIHRLTGHQGVIFSISYHERLQRICSVSDDRSIIMYRLRSPTSANSDNSQAPVDWNQVVIEPMLTVFGHSARVWDVVLLGDLFVSVGEDANCIVWNYEGKILQKFKGHKGQSIWSLAASEDESFVVTGGGDCSIRKWQLSTQHSVQVTHTPLAVPDQVKMRADDFVRTVVLWGYDQLVLMTNAGTLLCYNVIGGSWQTVVHDADFASYATLAVSPHTSLLAVGSITGYVRVVTQPSASEHGVWETKVKIHPGKICGLTWLTNQHILTTGLLGQCVVIRVDQSAEGSLTVNVVATLELPACKHRWVVSGCMLTEPLSTSSSFAADASLLSSAAAPESSSSSPVRLTEERTHLVCGDRNGSVHCYQLPASCSQTEVLLPSQTFSKIHGSAGVTSVRYHGNTVFTTGRDGHYRRWGLNKSCLQLLNSSRVCKGFDWIDRLWIKDGGLLILGFHSSKFLVWDVNQGERLLEVECGGGHRSWDCLSRGEDYRMAFLKAREVIIVDSSQKSAQDIVKPPLHGKKVWDMKWLSSHTDHRGKVQHVLCTGSEDTTLGLGVLHSNLNGCEGVMWRGQHTLHAHLSSVRCLATVRAVSTTPLTAGRRYVQQWPHPSSQHTCPESTHSTRESVQCSSASCAQKVNCGQISAIDLEQHHAVQTPGFSRPPREVTVVFSAGGRAQIQAWRVTVSEQDSLSEQKHSLDKRSSANLGLASPSLSSTDITTVEHPQPATKPDTAQMSQPCPTQASPTSVSTSYEHLGGCFLGESRHKRSHKPWKTRYLKLDPETRVMCLAAVSAHQLCPSLSPQLHLVAAAGSDGMLRLFMFEEESHHFTLLCQSSHHNGCILKVLIHLHPCPDNEQEQTGSSSHPHTPILLSAATDGCIAVWNLLPIVSWLRVNTSPSSYTSACGDQARFPSLSPFSSEDRADASKKFENEPGIMAQTTSSKNEAELEPASRDCGEQESSENESSDDGDERPAPQVQQYEKPGRTQYLGDMQPQLFSSHPSPAGAAKTAELSAVGVGTAAGGTDQAWSPVQVVNKAHQSGVNSLHVRSLPDGSVLVATGGDDNALTVHRLTMVTSHPGHRDSRDGGEGSAGSGSQRLFAEVAKVCRTDAHAAQITGVWIVSETHVLTASIDQRVTLWRLTHDSQILFERCCYVNLADPSNMEIWQHGGKIFVGVCGEGVALLSLHDHRADQVSADEA